MNLIKDINNEIREKDPVEVAVEETEPKPDTGKPIADYLTDIQAAKEESNQ